MRTAFKILSVFLFLGFGPGLYAQQAFQTPGLHAVDPWTSSDLTAPKNLATALNAGKEKPLVLNIGVMQDIKGSTHVGAASKTNGLSHLKDVVKNVSKTTPVIIYCGCCPFAKCPNIRPAFLALKQQGFLNIKLLDLPANLEKNWIAAGYPMAK